MFDGLQPSVLMYGVPHWLALFAFWLGVPLILVLRALRPPYMPWWPAGLSAAVLGWIGLNVSADLSNQFAEGQIVDQTLHTVTPNPVDNPYPFRDPWPPYSPVPFG
jgi:hypothetical protein